MKKPVIGITLDLVNGNDTRYNYSHFSWYALRQNYAQSIEKAGGIPLLIHHSYNLIEDILSIIDGLVIPGGDDLDPKLYGEEIISDTIILNNERSNFELVLVKKALEKNIPFLGICNGMQLLNVLLGGSLFQHLPDHFSTAAEHRSSGLRNAAAHLIHINQGTLLSTLISDTTQMVTSWHHQSVKELGKNLIISAKAPDGVIEAIELNNSKFVVGVQWHPEYLVSELDSKLFQKFIYHAQLASISRKIS